MKNIVQEIKAKIGPFSGKEHVAFWIGSAVSYGEPSGCASVSDIKKLVLNHLLQHDNNWLASSTILTEFKDNIFKLYQKNKENISEECKKIFKEIEVLPFEQFMNCVDEVNHGLADEIIKLACNSDVKSEPKPAPNTNHLLLVSIAMELIEKANCQKVTLYTTNYDTFLQQAFRELKAMKREEWPDLERLDKKANSGMNKYPIYQSCFSNGGVLRIVKPH